MVIKKILFVIIMFAIVSPIIYSLSITPISPEGNSVINENSVLLSIFINRYGDCSYSLDSGAFKTFPESEDVAVTTPGSIVVEGDAWMVRTGPNKLEISEDLVAGGINREIFSNITTFIDKGNLKALASGQVSNNKATSPYNQYLYLLGGPAERTMDSGYVIYTEDDDTDTLGDYLYFKSGREIGRYLLEFTTSFESGIYDSSSSSSKTGLFLTDYQDQDITMMGKKYTIVTAKRTSTAGGSVVLTLIGGAGRDTLLEKQTKTYTISGKDYKVTLNFLDSDEAQFTVNGQTTRKLKDGDTDKLSDSTTIGVTDILYQDYAGGIHSATFFLGANKLELKDTNVRDVASTNALKVDDDTIDDALVTIEGSDDNSTFKISRIHINMSADDNFYVPVGGKLSEAIKSAGGSASEPEVLFTENWDVEYRGLSKETTEKVRIITSGSNQYNLEFLDGDGNKVSVPIAKAPSGSALRFGEQDGGKALINKENKTISKDDYLIISDFSSHKRGERRTYVLQYKGADKVTNDNPVLKFKNIGSGTIIEQVYSPASSLDVVTPDGIGGKLATLKIGGSDFAVYNTSSILSYDFSIVLDLNADGIIKSTTPNATEPVVITTKNGMEINVTNETGNFGEDQSDIVFLTFRMPDDSRDGNAGDSVETLQATVMRFNITASSDEVRLAQDTTTEPKRLNFRTPNGKTNVAYAHDSYGNFYTWETPTSDPQLLTIEVPAKQRVPFVYITSKGASFIDKVPTITHVNKNKWKVSTSTKKLDLSEDLINGINREILSNITTFIDKNDLSGLKSESVTNNKGTSNYNQYMYVLGPSSEANIDSGYVIFTEDDTDVTADFLYFKSGREIGRYLLEFTVPLQSGIYNSSDSPSSTGLSLKDFDGVPLKLFGKNYTIANASRTSIEGNGINLTLISKTDKIELADTSIKDAMPSNYLKVNDSYIDDAFVIIQGIDDNSTFNISRIQINMTADDNFYVPSGGSLSQIIKDSSINSKPQVLFTENWDISYLGLGNATTQSIKLINTSLNQYNLEFVDGNRNIVRLPIATIQNGSQILMGNISQPFINRENLTITKNTYFVLTDGSKKRGERKSFILQYLGADRITSDNPVLKFKDLGDNSNIIKAFTNNSPLTVINIGDSNYKIFAADDPVRANLADNDFDIRVDMDKSGALNSDINSNLIITTSFGAEINITNQTGDNSILLSVRTPDDLRESNTKDNVDTLYPAVLIFNITSNSGNITHKRLGNLNFRVSSGQNNVEYAYTSYGAYIKREFSTNSATFEINYPYSQREALVYYENGGFQSELLTNLLEGQHNLSIKCSNIFGNAFNHNLSFNYTKIPLISNVSPANNSYNVSVNSNITINFRKRVDLSNLKSSILLKDSDNNKVSGILMHNLTTNQTIFDPVNFLKFNTTYTATITKNIKDLSGNSMESDYVWTFTTPLQDMDNDGLPDHEDNDADNDGIDDDMDFFKGNLSNINSNFPHLKMMIDSDENFSKIFNGTKKIEVSRGGIKLIEFDFIFSNNTKLDLSNLSILNASNSSMGGIIVTGISLSEGIKKKTTVERTNNSMNGICIKDEEIDWIDNISESCNAQNEYKIECDGTTQNGYTCIYNQTTNSYQVSGLSHSGIIQLSYTKPPNDDSEDGGSSGSGSSGGGGGGGGGGVAGNVCNIDWQCGEWIECTNGIQTRQCNFVKVAQHWQEASCPEESKPPLTSQACKSEITVIPSKTEPKQTKAAKNQSNNQNQITGMAVQETQKTNKLTAFVIAAMTAVLCVFSYYKFFRLEK